MKGGTGVKVCFEGRKELAASNDGHCWIFLGFSSPTPKQENLERSFFLGRKGEDNFFAESESIHAFN